MSRRYVHKIFLSALTVLMSVAAANAQKINFSQIEAGINSASQPKAEVLGDIAASMRLDEQAQKAKTAAALSGIAASMRAQSAEAYSDGAARTASQTDNSFYTGDITYSTYGIDARQDMSKNAVDRRNPFVMDDYTAGTTYAVASGSRYINSSSSRMSLPVRGALTSGYGYRPSFGRMHNGVDLALHTGDTVRSAMDGTVVLVSNDPNGYGRYVKVRHAGGLETLYGHLQMPSVVHGQRVAAGQAIGLGGATGNATGPHLHFETRLNGVAVDPRNYLNFPATRGNGTSPSAQPQQKKNTQSRPANSKSHKVQSETIATVQAPGLKRRTGTYQVRRGDTLEKIAREHGMSVGEICRLNKMSPYTPMYNGKVLRLK